VIIVRSFGKKKKKQFKKTSGNLPFPTKIGVVFTVYRNNRTEHFILPQRKRQNRKTY